ncbi:MAG: hypothetical protein ACHP9Y_00700 [Gammaproteobacteria bacterium]
MDCLSTRHAAKLGKKTPINTPFFNPQPDLMNGLLNRLAELEQRMLLQRYEIHVLEAEMEVLRSQPGMVG